MEIPRTTEWLPDWLESYNLTPAERAQFVGQPIDVMLGRVRALKFVRRIPVDTLVHDLNGTTAVTSGGRVYEDFGDSHLGVRDIGGVEGRTGVWSWRNVSKAS